MHVGPAGLSQPGPVLSPAGPPLHADTASLSQPEEASGGEGGDGGGAPPKVDGESSSAGAGGSQGGGQGGGAGPQKGKRKGGGKGQGQEGGGECEAVGGKWTVDELLALTCDVVRPVSLDDFEVALQQIMCTELELTSKYEEWNCKCGSGADKKQRASPKYASMYV